MKKHTALISTLLYSTLLHATKPIEHHACEHQTTWLLYSGFYGTRVGMQQHINIDTVLGNEYVPTKKNDSNILVGAGVFRPLTTPFSSHTQYGIQLFYLFQTGSTGKILLENTFYNLDYAYKLAYLPIYLDLKTTFASPIDKLKLTMDVGIGPNFTQLRSYDETPLLNITLPDNAYTSQVKTHLSTTVGTGVQLHVLPNDGWLEIAYRFFYLGSTKFKSYNPEYLSRLNTGTIYANAVVIAAHV